MHSGPAQRGQQRLLGADVDDLAAGGDGNLERVAIDHRGRGEAFEMQFDVVARPTSAARIAVSIGAGPHA